MLEAKSGPSTLAAIKLPLANNYSHMPKYCIHNTGFPPEILKY